MRKSEQIRQDFLDFFMAKKGHTFVPSAQVVPHGDPTLLFTNAGMNQFKDIFLGQGTRDYTKAANSQKCIRVSGKHNDLEEVGRDGYHHTFFEMLGNWSFADYYKKEAIQWAWELLTEVWKLPKDRLWATVYKDDDEAYKLWASVTDIGEDRILRFGDKDNFWEMGEVGPCGPCSEIHYDRTPDKSGRDLVNAGVPEVMEIWNLVFVQNERKADRSLVDLPARHVDTGMGFERIVAILQDKDTNYDTDIFSPIIDKIAELSKVPYGKGDAGIPHQVIADHIRMISFSIADGALPSNVGRGYVIRRILRRAARFGRKLNIHEPFLYKMVDLLGDMYSSIFPELKEQTGHIKKVIKAEEVSFNRTLDRGIQLFDGAVKDLKEGDVIPGDVVFQLYDTYGFPVDMTCQMAEEQNLKVNEAEYEKEMENAKARSRSNMKFTMDESDDEAAWVELNPGDETVFKGYETLETSSKILKYNLNEEDGTIKVILDQTPFYGESGGQVGDTGRIYSDFVNIIIEDTQKINGKTIHIGKLEAGEISSKPVTALVESESRKAIGRNHTATHLLHKALRDVLGNHVQQKGSIVDQERLRFDFSHYEGMKPEEIKKVELAANRQIRENLAVTTGFHPIDEAKEMGAMALFGEKYDDVVRVVSIDAYSKELCGGTHCNSTGDIGLVRIVSEGSISTGIRRIEAVTGNAALQYIYKKEAILNEIRANFKCGEPELSERVGAAVSRLKEVEKENQELKSKLQAAAAGEMVEKAVKIGDAALLAEFVEVSDAGALKGFAEKLKDKIGSGVVVLGADTKGKAAIVVAVTKDLVARGIKAGDIIKPVAAITGGGGGGAPHMAQAGGKQPEKLKEAIAHAKEVVEKLLEGK